MNILIIGAGAAGLMAAHRLSKMHNQVTILEARERVGGRIHTIHEGEFSSPVDLGAEFIHGNLPITLGLLKEADISFEKQDGEMWHCNAGRFYQEEQDTEHWETLMEKLNTLAEDLPIKTFMEQHFQGEHYSNFRDSVLGLVAGMDAANPADASAFALRNEWNGSDEEQYTVAGGYGRLIRYLEESCKAAGAVMHLNSPVKTVFWEAGKVQAKTTAGTLFDAEKIIITVPIGVLQASDGAQGSLQFQPEIPDYLNAAKGIGSGNALKILLQFRADFWRTVTGQDLTKMSFLLSNAMIPTWWTQYPKKSALLTGWLGGPRAYELKDLSKEEVLEKGLASLSEIFGKPMEELTEMLEDWRIAMWPAQPYSRGAYSYATVETLDALKVLNTPLEDTIYFAGEACYYGSAMGTVEAALASANAVVEQITKSQSP